MPLSVLRAATAAVPLLRRSPLPAAAAAVAAWHSAYLGLLTVCKRITMGDHRPMNAPPSPSRSRPRIRTPPSASSVSAGSDLSPTPPQRYAIRHVPQSPVIIDGSRMNPSQRPRRPRRKAEEVERLYKCTWEGCEKSYGTL